MKKSYFFVLITATTIGGLAFTKMSKKGEIGKCTYKNSGGPVNGGYTGAPGDANCTACHAGQVQTGPGNTLVLLDANQNPVTAYTPGVTYTVGVQLTSPNPKNGFQTTARRASDNSTAGNMAAIMGSSRVDIWNGKQYAAHTSASNTSQIGWAFTWTAPANDVGNIVFYLATNKTNNQSNSSGDVIRTSQHVFPVAAPPAQPGAITGNSSVCSGSSNTYSVAAVAGATSYNWTLPSGWTGSSTTNSITVTAGMSNGNISVSATNAYGTSQVSTLGVTSLTVPSQPGAISGNITVCSGSLNDYSVLSVIGATSYTWTLPSGWTGSSITNSISTTAGLTGDITVKANNSCGSSLVRTLNVTSSSAPNQPGAITGNTTICSGSINTYSVTNDLNATNYTWTLPSGWTGSSTTNSIVTTAGLTGDITVMANNSCGSSVVRTLSVTSLSTVPDQPGVISGNSTICSGSSNTYSVTNDLSATSYTWTLPSGWTGSSTTNSIVTTAGLTGDITVMANNGCGSSVVSTLSVTTSTVPDQPEVPSGSATICVGNFSYDYSVSPISGATSYTWILPQGWTGSSTTNMISAVAPIGASSGDISVMANNSCGSSDASMLSVTSLDIPSQPGTIMGNSLVCSGSSNTYSVTIDLTATSYTWTLPQGWTGTSTTNSISTTAGAMVGDITVRADNSCGSSSLQTLSVSNLSPSISQLWGTLTANPAGLTYQWIDCNNNNTPIQGETNQDFVPATNGDYAVMVTVSSNGCTETSTCYTMTSAGINENKLNDDHVIYPNPSNGKFIIEMKELYGELIQIYNIVGEIVFVSEISANKFEINLNLLSGVYHYEIKSKGNIRNGKLIIH